MLRLPSKDSGSSGMRQAERKEREEEGVGENKPGKQGNGSKLFLLTEFQMQMEMKIYLGNQVPHSSIFKQ